MISSAPSFAAKWLAPRLERFQNQNPEAEVSVFANVAITDFKLVRYRPRPALRQRHLRRAALRKDHVGVDPAGLLA